MAIELFSGSKRDLEDMTGVKYESMRTSDGNLLRIDVLAGKDGWPTNLAIDHQLVKDAEKVSASALVHVTYLPQTGTLRPGMAVPRVAFGYAVKTIDELSLL